MKPYDFEFMLCKRCEFNQAEQVYAVDYSKIVGLCSDCIDAIGAPLSRTIEKDEITMIEEMPELETVPNRTERHQSFSNIGYGSPYDIGDYKDDELLEGWDEFGDGEDDYSGAR